jgi:hypothetical protein
VIGKRPRRKRGRRTWPIVLVGCLVAVVALGSAVILHHPSSQATTTSSSTQSSTSGYKYIILYINQGNGAVNESNFESMLSFATSHGFNTIFFQIYREGALLFDNSQLEFFVGQAHAQNFKLFFSLYFTNSSQTIPTSVYGDDEDGISLDMSTLSIADQSSLFESLQQGYTSGLTAITTTDLTLSLTPDLLVLETYTSQIQQYSQYIHPGVIASVGVFDTTSKLNYQQEFQYALTNSDGVMVFDYAGLMKSGY